MTYDKNIELQEMQQEKERLELEVERLKKLCETMDVKLRKTKDILKLVSSIINIDMDILSKKLNEEIRKL